MAHIETTFTLRDDDQKYKTFLNISNGVIVGEVVIGFTDGQGDLLDGTEFYAITQDDAKVLASILKLISE